MTPILGEIYDEVKKTRSYPKILPRTVIYDFNLIMLLLASMSATSGANAIAHMVKALYAQKGNPIITLLALEGIKALACSPPQIVRSPNDIEARTKALYGAWLYGLRLGSVGMSLHHKLCHTLGGSFNLPHVETHTIVLPHALAYNAPEIHGVMNQLAEVLPDSDGGAIKDRNGLLDSLHVKHGLKEFNMKEQDVVKAADIAVLNSYWNPSKVEREGIRELIRRIWAGESAKANF